ncbi:MAG: hypothetical protein JW969_18300 [Spirochaetales bacterium]|nr:hypothetical protein [Spirochaetales bacterium]
MLKRKKLIILSAVLFAIFAFSALSADEWAPYTYYTKGTVVTYQGASYTCRQSHTSLPGWEPPYVLALWLPGGTVSTSTPVNTSTPTNTTFNTATSTHTLANTATPTYTPVFTATPTRTEVNTPSPTSTSDMVVNYTDNFNDNAISYVWSFYGSGTWSEQGSILRQDSTSQNDPCKAILSGTALSLGTNQGIRAKVYVSSWADGDSARAGVSLYTSTSDGRGYNLLFHNNHSTVQWLDDMVAWGPSYTFNWSNQTWYWFRMVMYNGVLYGKIWQDGTAEPYGWPYSWERSGRGGYPALNGGTSGHGGSCTVFFDDMTANNYSSIADTPTSGVTSTPTNGATSTPTRTATPTRTPTPSPGNTPVGGLPKHVITGYWQNFTNGATALKLRDVPAAYNLIAVAFADATTTAGAVSFTLDSGLASAVGGYSQSDFISDISSLHSQGRRVIISVGGQNGTISVASSSAATNFANSIVSLMNQYGFDGVDIDLENGVNSTYMSQALRSIASSKSGAIITMAPQTIDMQSTGYEYFKLALAIKDILTICNMQYYNSGTMLGYDQQVYAQGTENFLTALATIQLMNGLRPDQVGLGLPASTSAAGGGYVDPSVVNAALDCLAAGTNCGTYHPPTTFPGIRGAMTWSINWDASNGYRWVNTISAHLPSVP